MLFIIANRLPIKITRKDEKLYFEKNSGGLVSGLISLRERKKFLWVGNITGNFSSGEKEEIENQLRKDDCIPVFISDELNDAAYNGYANRVLWPLLHQFPDCSLFGNQEAYYEFNKKFAMRINNLIDESSEIWIHDYHLFLLPSLLKIRKRTGFFLHTTFPPAKSFPRAYKFLIEGLTAASTIAFHTYEYSGNFKALLKEFNINYTGLIETVPIGITPNLFTKEIKKENRFSRLFKNRYVVLGVDRIDFIKGIPNRIEALNRLNKKDILYIQVGIPSRQAVREYTELSHLIKNKIENIEGLEILLSDPACSVSTIYLNQSVTFDDLVALYSMADMCIISSLVDGMNLVALEYTACSNGILVMSECAGAACTLPGALFHNPWIIEDLMQCIERGYLMEKSEIKRRVEVNRRNIEKFNAEAWADANIKFIQS